MADAGAEIQAAAPAAAAAAAQLAGDVASMHIASGSSKPAHFIYTSTTELSKEHVLLAWQLVLRDDKIPEANWARRAMRFLSPDILALFMGTDITPKDVDEMTWETFKTGFLQINAGSMVNTTYGLLRPLDSFYYKPHKNKVRPRPYPARG